MTLVTSNNNTQAQRRPLPGRHVVASPTQEELRSTITQLNNYALSMLQIGCSKNTIDTFKDALSIQKSGVDPSRFAAVLARAEERLQYVTEHIDDLSPTDVVALSIDHDAKDAYDMLTQTRTSKVCLILSEQQQLPLAAIRSVLVYNYGIAHRCCPPKATEQGNNHVMSFCLQIFQYSEKLIPDDFKHNLFRLVLTRNLMMLSCRLGMTLCEHYKETLDPVVADITGPIAPDAETDNGSTPAA